MELLGEKAFSRSDCLKKFFGTPARTRPPVNIATSAKKTSFPSATRGHSLWQRVPGSKRIHAQFRASSVVTIYPSKKHFSQLTGCAKSESISEQFASIYQFVARDKLFWTQNKKVFKKIKVNVPNVYHLRLHNIREAQKTVTKFK